MPYDVLDVRYYTVEEIADLLKISKMSVYRAVQSGELHSVRPGGRLFRVPEPALRAWISDTSHTS